MKKLIALISAIAVMGTMSMTAFAGIEATPNKLETGAALEENAEGGYKASFTSAEVNTQTTILAVNGTAINTNSIMYINQLAQDSETTINFDLKAAPAVGETVYVYMGGDKLSKKTVGTITNVADATGYTVKGYVANYADAEFFESEDFVLSLEEAYEDDAEGYAAELTRLKNEYAINAYLFAKSDLEAYANYFVGETEEMPTVVAQTKVSETDGSFVFESIAKGEYLLVIIRDGIVPYFDYITVNDANVENTDEVELFYGDTIDSCDGYITPADANAINQVRGYVGDEDFAPIYDVNIDGETSPSDANYANTNRKDLYQYDTEATADLEEMEII